MGVIFGHRKAAERVCVRRLKSELSDEQLKLKRVSELIVAYESIVEGNYIDNLIKAQTERKQAERQKPSIYTKL